MDASEQSKARAHTGHSHTHTMATNNQEQDVWTERRGLGTGRWVGAEVAGGRRGGEGVEGGGGVRWRKQLTPVVWQEEGLISHSIVHCSDSRWTASSADRRGELHHPNSSQGFGWLAG